MMKEIDDDSHLQEKVRRGGGRAYFCAVCRRDETRKMMGMYVCTVHTNEYVGEGRGITGLEFGSVQAGR